MLTITPHRSALAATSTPASSMASFAAATAKCVTLSLLRMLFLAVKYSAASKSLTCTLAVSCRFVQSTYVCVSVRVGWHSFLQLLRFEAHDTITVRYDWRGRR